MKIHLIGIGGIGVSALAQYYLTMGHEVSGSDLAVSETTNYLKKLGIKIHKNSESAPLIETDLVVFSPAVKKSNPELKSYLENKTKCISYPEALGEITKKYFTIAISGAHGKSTTASMLALILIKAGFDPTVIIGTKLKEFGGSNFRTGKSKYMVIEACEYDSSFLHYNPQQIIITNIDKEHLDYFKSLKNILKAFKNFIQKLPESGVLAINEDDKNTVKLVSSMKNSFKVCGFKMESKEAKILEKILKVPGKHNIYNALGATAVARELKIDDDVIFKALSEFKGTWRRFEERDRKIGNAKIRVVNDYGHHPNEIKVTFEAAREKYPNRKIWCVFQPHQRQRTLNLFDDFVKVFKDSNIDSIIIVDIYDVAGREEKTTQKKVSSKMLARKINKRNVRYLSILNAEKYVKRSVKNNDILIIMGAGDIYEKFGQKI